MDKPDKHSGLSIIYISLPNTLSNVHIMFIFIHSFIHSEGLFDANLVTCFTAYTATCTSSMGYIFNGEMIFMPHLIQTIPTEVPTTVELTTKEHS